MKVIGLCGGSGSGKGEVCRLFARFGVPSVDTDAVYRSLTEQKSDCLDEITEHFGTGVLNTDGSLNRQALAEIVFSDKDALRTLNSITHKHILNVCRASINNARMRGDEMILIDAPLLFESGFNRECDVVIAVVAPIDTRIARIVLRDGITEEAAERRIASQIDDAFYYENADFVINNGKDIFALNKSVEEIYVKLREIG